MIIGRFLFVLGVGTLFFLSSIAATLIMDAWSGLDLGAIMVILEDNRSFRPQW